MRISSCFALALLSFTMACPKQSASAPDASKAGAASDCANACIRLDSLGCPEAQPSDSGDSCAATCEHAQTSKMFDMKPQCLANAKTVEDLRACGTVTCKK